ncbi:MAG: helicase, partial [Gammaproteobacteria bacterium]|nr:helicase [Gammaproteobacteria bacterium]
MIELERARSALSALDSGCSHDEWIRIGMAAKAAGLSFDEFHAWSKNAANYLEKDCHAAWKSFDKAGGITEATLFFKAIEVGWKDSHDRDSCTIISKKNTNPKHNNAEVSNNAKVLEIWQRCLPADNNYPYILGKQGRPDGLRVYPKDVPPLIISGQNVAGYLVVPCMSNGKIQTLQFIPPNGGKKLNLGGAKYNDGYFVVGKINDTTKPIYICEGIGHAWSINEATKASAVVCFGGSRIQRVANILRKQYPKAQLIIVPDSGRENEAAKIANTIDGQWVKLPDNIFTNYDVNDYALEHGYEALALLLKQTNAPAMRYQLLSGADLLDAPPMRWMVNGVLPAEGLAALYGASGSGKSFLILNIGCAIAAGDNYWFSRRIIQSPVTYACLEGEAGIGKRLKAWSLYFKRPLPDALRFITQPFDLLSNDVPELAKAVVSAG